MKYSLISRGNPRYPEHGKKVYASAQTFKTLSVDEFIDGIMYHGSAYKRGDYKAMMSTFAEELANKLKEGYRINMGEMGTFYPTLDCEGASSMEEFNPEQHIKGIRVNWVPSDDFKNLRQGGRVPGKHQQT